MAKPFLKWAGGKGQLLEQFLQLYPTALKQGKISSYCEPFVGGGAVFFDIASRCPIAKAYLSDLNPDLVISYTVIRDSVADLIGALGQLSEEYARCGSEDKRKSFFLSVREKFNDDRGSLDYSGANSRWIQRVAWLIFLNRTCFNGLYRVNKRGDFNVPFGKYVNPKILDAENLRSASVTLERAEIKRADFADCLKVAKRGSFVYFDPPYRPISRTASFTSYSSEAFGEDEQRRLAEVFAKLARKGAQVMLSNSDPKNETPDDNFFDDLYADYNVMRVSCRRAINSKADRRGPIKEIVVTNYPVNLCPKMETSVLF